MGFVHPPCPRLIHWGLHKDTRAWNGLDRLSSGGMGRVSSGDIALLSSGDIALLSSGDIAFLFSGDIALLSSGDIALLSSGDIALFSSGNIALLSSGWVCSRLCLWLIIRYLLHDCLTGLSLGLTFDFSPVIVEMMNYCLSKANVTCSHVTLFCLWTLLIL